jgi:hypothetical protein
VEGFFQKDIPTGNAVLILAGAALFFIVAIYAPGILFALAVVAVLVLIVKFKFRGRPLGLQQ